VSVALHAQTVDPDAARRAAQQITSDRRFHNNPAPRPLRGPAQWLGDRVHGITTWIGDRFSAVPDVVWIMVGIAAVAAIVARVIVVSRRRRVSVAAGAGARGPGADAPEDPDDLERAADDAEHAGDLDRALRLRFRAGLLRLGRRGAIEYRPSVTTGEVRRALGSDTFDELARAFENVAYGGRAAAAPDVDNARRDWPRVLQESGRR
jgi:hypothetical protein